MFQVMLNFKTFGELFAQPLPPPGEYADMLLSSAHGGCQRLGAGGAGGEVLEPKTCFFSKIK